MTNEELAILSAEADAALRPLFAKIDETAQINTARVLDAFREERVSDACFAGTTGYGYDDRGRETLDRVWSRVFGTDASLVRQNFVNGTHTISTALFGLLRPSDVLLSVTGKPYDTLDGVIGIGGADGRGSLCDFGVKYEEIAMADGKIDLPAVRERLLADSGKRIRVVFVQRSKGYLNRRTLTPEEISEAYLLVHSLRLFSRAVLL